MEKRYLPSIDICKGTEPELVIKLMMSSGGSINIPKGMSKEAWPLLEQILSKIPVYQVEFEEGIMLDLIMSEGIHKECFIKIIEVKKTKTKSKEFSKWLEDMAEEVAEVGKIPYLEVMRKNFGLGIECVRTRYVKDKKTLAYMKEHGARVDD